jgi:uncharacterized membrane protein
MTDPRFILSILILAGYIYLAISHADKEILTALRDALLMAVTFFFHGLGTERSNGAAKKADEVKVDTIENVNVKP